MRSRTSLARLLSGPALASLAALLTGCGSDASVPRGIDDTKEASEPIVNTTAPASGTGTLDDLPPVGSGRARQVTSSGAAAFYNGAPVDASFTDGRDLMSDIVSTSTDWTKAAVGGPSDAAPGFDATLSQAVDAANGRKAELSGGSSDALVKWVGAGATTTIGTPESTFTGYTPVRGRWLSAGRTRSESAYTTYPAPAELGEMRERGARLYCSAREAARQQASTERMTAGEISAASVSIFGHQIDFLVLEPTTYVGAPERYFAAGNDGKQAFHVPLELGSIITPIRGVGLPSLDEIRYPLSIVTGDSEVQTDNNLTWVGTSWGIAPKYLKKYQTVTNASAFVGAHKASSAERPIKIIDTPNLKVSLKLGLSVDVGSSYLDDDHVLTSPYEVWGTYPAARAGHLWANPSSGYGAQYHDGAWAFMIGSHGEIAPTPDRWNILSDNGAGPFVLDASAVGKTMHTRLQNDDDHTISAGVTASLSADLSAAVDYNVVGPFQIGVGASGGLSGFVFQGHTVRDGVVHQRYWDYYEIPTGTVSVKPRSAAWVNANAGNVSLRFSVYLPIVGSITREFKVLGWDPKPLASFDTKDGGASTWPESASLRMGVSSDHWGDPTKQPWVGSHLPRGSEYGSLPADVDTCLADTSPVPSPPPACSGRGAEGDPLHPQICVVKPTRLSNVCGRIAQVVSWESSTPAQRSCLEQYYAFLCSPTSHEESTGSGEFITGYVSHRIDISDAATMTQLRDLQNTCVGAFVPMTGDSAADQDAARNYLDKQFAFQMCGDDAKPVPGGSLTMDPVGPVGSAPTASAPKPCD